MEDTTPGIYERPVSDEFSVALGREIARALVDRPDAVLTAARRNLAFMRRVHGDGSADGWFDRWERLLDGPIEEVTRVLTSDAEPDRLMRQNTPFAGAIPSGCPNWCSGPSRQTSRSSATTGHSPGLGSSILRSFWSG